MRKEQHQLDILLASALIQLVDQQPLFYKVLRNLPKIWVDGIQSLGGVGIDKTSDQICILLNSTRLLSASPFEIKIVLEHILHHLILKHYSENRYNAGPLLHLATDFLINHSIKDFSDLIPSIRSKRGVFKNIGYTKLLSKLPGINILKLDKTSSHELFHLMSQDIHMKWSTLDTIDDHQPYLVEGKYSKRRIQTNDVEEGYIDEKVKELVCAAAQELKRERLGYGNLPGNLEMVIKEMIGEAEVNYGHEMRQFAKSTMVTHLYNRTWSRVNRRYGFNNRGKKTVKGSRIVVILDTSRSIWADKTFNKFLVEINSLKSVCDDLWIIAGDVGEGFRLNLKNKTLKPEMLKFRGGGGTNLQFGFDAAKELNADGIFVFTDGEIPEFQSFDIPTLILLTPGGLNVKGYRNLQLEKI